MITEIGQYDAEFLGNGDLTIDYRRSPRDRYVIIFYGLMSLIPFYCSFWLSMHTHSKNLMYVLPLIAGIYLLTISFKAFSKPLEEVFYADQKLSRLIVKKNIFRAYRFDFSDIANFTLTPKDITTRSIRRLKTNDYFIYLDVTLKSGEKQLIHRFERPDLAVFDVEAGEINKILDQAANDLTKLISETCGKDLTLNATVFEYFRW